MVCKALYLSLLLISICFFAAALSQEQKTLDASVVSDTSVLRRQESTGNAEEEKPSEEFSNDLFEEDLSGEEDAPTRLLKAKKSSEAFYHPPAPVQKKQPRVIIQHLTKIPVEASKVPVYSGKHSMPLHSEKHSMPLEKHALHSEKHSLPLYSAKHSSPLYSAMDSHGFKAPHRLLKKKKISNYYPEVPVQKKQPVVIIQQSKHLAASKHLGKSKHLAGSKHPVEEHKGLLHTTKQFADHKQQSYHSFSAPHRLLKKKKWANYYPEMPVEKKQPVMVIQQSKPVVVESHKFPLHETKHSADYGMHKHDFAAPHRYLKKKRANYYPQMPVQKKQPIMVVQRPSKKSGPMLQYSAGFGKKF